MSSPILYFKVTSLLIALLASFGNAYAGTRLPGECNSTKSSFLGPGNKKMNFSGCGVRPEDNPGAAGKLLNSAMVDILCEGADCTGTREKSAIEDYVDRVNPAAYKDTRNIGESNSGLRRFQQNSLSATPSCLGSLAYRFYADREILEKGPTTLIGTSQKGLTWNTASKYCGGQPDLCVSMIGICGHDDSVKDFGEMGMSICLNAADTAKARSATEPKCLEPVSKPGQPLSTYIDCPAKGTAFFQNGGLPSVEISSELKAQIAREQAPLLDAPKALGALPHKYYHAYGASYFTCQLIESGLPAAKAVEVERLTSLMYRAIRVCEAGRVNMNNFQNTLKTMKSAGLPAGDIDFSEKPEDLAKSWNQQSAPVVAYLTSKVRDADTMRSIGLLPKESAYTKLSADDQAALAVKVKNYPGYVLAGYLSRADQTHLSDFELLQSLKKSYGEVGAGYFVNTFKKLRKKMSWVGIGGKLLGGVSDQVRNLGDLAPCLQSVLLNYATGHDYKCSGFKDCGGAQAKLTTYHADFLQSDELHKMGAAFAQKNCQPITNPSQTIEARACVALKTVQDRENALAAPATPGVPSDSTTTNSLKN